MSKLTHYQVFVAIVETGSINQAALHLNYSAPAVSKQLSKLEANLKTQLFHRSHKKFEITKAGEQFYPRCKAILSSVSQAENELLSTDKNMSGTISITLSKALARSKIFDALSAFTDKHPLIQFKINFSDKFENLHDENLDFAFRLGKLHDSSHMIGIPLIDTQLIACARPSYLALHGTPKSLSDLNNAKLILLSPRNSSEELKIFFQKEKFQKETSTVHVCNDVEGVYQSVRAGLGIGMLLDISIENEIKKGTFTSLFSERGLPQKTLYLIYKKSQWTSRKETTFKDHIKTFFLSDIS